MKDLVHSRCLLQANSMPCPFFVFPIPSFCSSHEGVRGQSRLAAPSTLPRGHTCSCMRTAVRRCSHAHRASCYLCLRLLGPAPTLSFEPIGFGMLRPRGILGMSLGGRAWDLVFCRRSEHPSTLLCVLGAPRLGLGCILGAGS